MKKKLTQNRRIIPVTRGELENPDFKLLLRRIIPVTRGERYMDWTDMVNSRIIPVTRGELVS